MKKILFIEDDSVLRENTAELLELSDYEVVTATNGKTGIEMAIKHLPDIIICDIMMPEVDGYGVLEAVSLNAETAHIPFIFLSAKTEHKEIRKGMDLGADDYLTKPFEEEELLSAIETRLAKAVAISSMFDRQSKKKETEDEVRNLHELKNLFDDSGELKTYEAGETIYREGAYSTQVYLILKGVVKSHRIEESGKELITALHQPDEFLGFTSFVEHVPYQETATAMEAVELAALPKNLLNDILSKNRKVSLDLLNIITQDLAVLKSQLLQMAYSSVKRKTAQSILHFARVLNKNPSDTLKVSRNDLASVAGIATESFIRALSDFKKNGYIEVKGRDITITNLKALQEME
ncbi:response regulator [Leeuwenhoekiella parthenopeia]|uniref:Response regulator n=1 Tax=Leeuwenhoekiella parthenopeia TaxID=2890320 RepID=A0ABS8GVB8_9FLAO|nr:response regulator [Leeuwenhoekiella parthenopeia]MCC4213962.1 response regulator [Leeuwenhoekiella parthenopeia]